MCTRVVLAGILASCHFVIPRTMAQHASVRVGIRAAPERAEVGQPIVLDLTLTLSLPARNKDGRIASQIKRTPVLEIIRSGKREVVHFTGGVPHSFHLADDHGLVYRAQFLLLVGGTPGRRILRDPGVYHLKAALHPMIHSTPEGELQLEVIPSSSDSAAALAMLHLEKDWPLLLAGIGADGQGIARLRKVATDFPDSPLGLYSAVRLGLLGYKKRFSLHNNRGGPVYREVCPDLERAFDLPIICPIRRKAVECLVYAEIMAGDIQRGRQHLQQAIACTPIRDRQAAFRKIRAELDQRGLPGGAR
jgi:hypothetical protein